jgi:hypothetical protein
VLYEAALRLPRKVSHASGLDRIEAALRATDRKLHVELRGAA